ncbi:flagellar basal body-associated FliL family protein [Roseivivax sp. CAU 1761]
MSEAEKPKRSLKKRLLVTTALVLFCVAAGAGGLGLALGPSRALALLSGGAAAEEGDSVEGAAEAAPAAAAGDGTELPEGMAKVVPLDTMIVNITAMTLTGRKTSRFLKLDIALVVDPAAAGAERISERELFLRDSIQDYLRQLTEDDLEGSAGLAQLKSELLRRVRTVTDSTAPQDILIADMVIQ